MAAPPGGHGDQGRPRGRGHHPRHRRQGAAVPRRPGLPGAGRARTACTAPRRATRCRCASWPPSARSTSCWRWAWSRWPGADSLRGGRRVFELCRVRLFSVGPPGARYQDVCLDLRGVGAPVPPRPRGRPTCSPPTTRAACRAGRPRRRCCSWRTAAASRCCSSWCSRCCCRAAARSWARRAPMCWRSSCSARTSRTWRASGCTPPPGRCSSPARCREWPGHVVSSRRGTGSPTPGTRSGPGPAFGLDDLPFTHDGRRVTMAAFKDRLHGGERRAGPGRGAGLGDRRTASGRATSSTSGSTRSCSATSAR